MNRFPYRSAGLILLLLLLGCGDTSTSLPQPTARTHPSPPAATVTAMAAATAAPVPSPHSTTPLVYERDGDLWAYNGSSHRPLTDDGRSYQPLLSPDGRFLLFRRQEEPTEWQVEIFSLWVIELESGQERQLDLSVLPPFPTLSPEGETVDLPRQPSHVAWLPDGKTILFDSMVNVSVLGPGGHMFLDDLWLASAETGQVRNLLAGEGQQAKFFLSPDGQWALLGRPSRIDILNLGTVEQRTLFEFSPVATYSEYSWLPEPHWLPDSRHIHVAIAPADPIVDTVYALWRLDVEGGAVERMGQVKGSSFAWSPTGISWSPDGARLLYVEDVRRLVLSDAAGGNGQEIAVGERLSVAGWSPDGRVALYQDGATSTLYGIAAGPHPVPRALGQIDPLLMGGLLWWEGDLFVQGEDSLLHVATDGSGVQEVGP